MINIPDDRRNLDEGEDARCKMQEDTSEGNMCNQLELEEEEHEIMNDLEMHRKFLVDYCKRGSTKCKRCHSRIPKDELRIGKSAPFKTKTII